MQAKPNSQADRIAVTKLFKEIAAFGRQVRERRAAEAVAAQSAAFTERLQPVSTEDSHETLIG